MSKFPATVFNLSVALQRLGSDAGLLQALADFYVQDVPPLLQATRTAIEHGNIEEAILGAHSIKGLSATFDASEAYSAAEHIERAGLSGDLNSMRQGLGELQRAVAIVIDGLRSEVLTGC